MPAMHEIDYKIIGEDMQFVEVELDPGEATVAEAGAMMYMEDGIEMETIFGDGSQQQGGGFLGALMGAGKRLLTGESLFMTYFRADSNGEVGFAGSYPGRIQVFELVAGQSVLVQRDSFLFAQPTVQLNLALVKKLGAGFFGGEGFILEKLTGPGTVFIHGGGDFVEFTLQPGEMLRAAQGLRVMPDAGVEPENSDEIAAAHRQPGRHRHPRRNLAAARDRRCRYPVERGEQERGSRPHARRAAGPAGR